jgi:hypothetical protein
MLFGVLLPLGTSTTLFSTILGDVSTARIKQAHVGKLGTNS